MDLMLKNQFCSLCPPKTDWLAPPFLAVTQSDSCVMFPVMCNSSFPPYSKLHQISAENPCSKRSQAKLESQCLCWSQCGYESQQSSSKSSCAYPIRCRCLEMSRYCAFLWDKTRAVIQWSSVLIPFLTFEIFAQVFLRYVHTFSIYSEGKKEKRKEENQHCKCRDTENGQKITLQWEFILFK